jgi:amino acid adenylation domain-containing protein
MIGPHLHRDAPAEPESCSVMLPADASGAVQGLAHQADCTPTTVLCAALAALLHRYVGEDDIRFALGAALTVRIDMSAKPTFRALVDRTRIALAAVHSNPRVDPDVDAGAIQFDLRLLGGAPLAINADVVNVHCASAAQEGGVRLRFDAAPYAYEDIARFAKYYQRFVTSAAADADRPVCEVPVMTAAERAQQLEWGRGRRRPYEDQASLPMLWATQAERCPQAIALIDERTHITYAQLEERSNQLARHLVAAGVAGGSTVGVCFDRSIELPIALLAILKAGGTYVPLDLTYPRERIDMMIADSAIRFIVSRGPVDALASFAGRIIRMDAESDAIARASTQALALPIAASAGAYITYTSGSTGRPKGVSITHRAVARLVRGFDYARITSDDTYLAHAPLAFDASTFEIWAPLLNGARLAIPRPGLLTMNELGATVERFDVTTLFLTTTLFGRLVESNMPAFGHIRQLLTGGEVASPEHMRRFLEQYPESSLIAVYGPTENTTFSTWYPLPDARAIGTSVAIGRPIANSTAYVVDPFGQIAPSGVPGELWVGGDGVAAGYVNRPDLDGERFRDDPFSTEMSSRVYVTGDRARWRADGVLEFLGRTDDQVKIRGFRIELGEIESILQAHPDVGAAALVVATLGAEKTLCAFVSARAGAGLSEAGLRTYLAEKLPRYMLPHRIDVVAALPQGASGKIDRRSLVQLVERPQAALKPTFGQISAGRELEQAVTAIWREVLGLDRRPAIDENFFDAGGDSLRLLTLHARLQNLVPRNIPIMALFEQTTIRKITAFLTKAPTG